MVARAVRGNARALVVVAAAGVEGALEARETAARNYDPQAVAGQEVVARDERLERDLIDLVALHPHFGLVVAVAVAHALDRLVEVERAAVRIDVDDLDGEV